MIHYQQKTFIISYSFLQVNPIKQKPSIPPQILFCNGVDLIGDDMELALEYQKEIEMMRDKWSRKGKGQKANLFKYMSVCPRATYKTSIIHLLEHSHNHLY